MITIPEDVIIAEQLKYTPPNGVNPRPNSCAGTHEPSK